MFSLAFVCVSPCRRIALRFPLVAALATVHVATKPRPLTLPRIGTVFCLLVRSSAEATAVLRWVSFVPSFAAGQVSRFTCPLHSVSKLSLPSFFPFSPSEPLVLSHARLLSQRHQFRALLSRDQKISHSGAHAAILFETGGIWQNPSFVQQCNGMARCK